MREKRAGAKRGGQYRYYELGQAKNGILVASDGRAYRWKAGGLVVLNKPSNRRKKHREAVAMAHARTQARANDSLMARLHREMK